MWLLLTQSLGMINQFYVFHRFWYCLKSLITSITQQRWHGCQWEPTLSVLVCCIILSWCFWCCKWQPPYFHWSWVKLTNCLDFTDSKGSLLFAESLTSFSDSLQLDNDACTKVNSMIIPCCEDLIELKSDHNHKIVEITENAGKYLLDEYVVSF